MEQKKFSEENQTINDIEVLDLGKDIDETENDGVAESSSQSKGKKQGEEDFDWKREILSWVVTLAITFALIFVLKNYVLINAMVPTGSMENTIMPDDQLFGNRLAYVFDEPERGDIIFFYYPDDETQKFVKRIIGLPGETVIIEDGKVYINGSEVPLEEPYLKEEWRVNKGPYVFEVPEGCYFVMGDNRNTSRDAREWKNTYVAKEKIIGKAMVIYYPFDRMGVVE